MLYLFWFRELNFTHVSDQKFMNISNQHFWLFGFRILELLGVPRYNVNKAIVYCDLNKKRSFHWVNFYRKFVECYFIIMLDNGIYLFKKGVEQKIIRIFYE